MFASPKYFITALISGAVLTALIYTGCHKRMMASEDIGYTTDHATSEQTFNDVQTVADQASTVSSGSLNYRTTATTGSGCATVTHTGDSIIIDFGPSDCVCHDGRLRRGEIIVTYTGHYADSGSVHTITFNNFYQNDNKVTGYKMVTNMGHNALGQPYYAVQIAGGITLSGGGTISCTWSRTRTWTAGYNTPTDPTDDVYQVTGNGSMTRANGQLVNINISVPLVAAYSCRWIESGTVIYSLPGGLSRSLNFGDTPVCDDMAVVTLANGTTRNITLP